MSNAYSVVSKYYNKLIEYPYDKVLALVQKYKKSGKVLDLFCGTGRFTISLAKQGYEAVGSDLSSEMLQKAMEDARSQGCNVVFKKENALNFSTFGDLSLVTATCDGLNYIEKSKLETFFQRVYNSLSEGGYFIFDVSSFYKITEVLGNNVYYEDYDELTFFWRNTLRKKDNSVKLELTFFIPDGKGNYTREDETQRQYAHKEEELREFAEKAGFSVSEVLGENFQSPKSTSERLYFVLKKQERLE